MAEALLLGAISGAIVSALLTEVIDAAKNAIRCKENCDNLLSTLKSVKPLLDRVTQSSDSGNAACQAWLTEIHSLLVKAKSTIGKCTVKKSRLSFVYVKKWPLSSSIKDIDRQIKEKLPESNLLTLDIVQLMYQIMAREYVSSPMADKSTTFETQPVPPNIVEFERNPFNKLKELIISVADAPSGEPMTIGLKGRGGAGKTLIAKMVNNDEVIKTKYGASSILWITIGHDASVSSAYLTMGKFLSDGGVFERDYAHRNLVDQRRYLMEAFKLRRTLLILDDVWENSSHSRAMIDWLDVCKGRGSATLITTRNDSVLVRAKAKERIDVLSLSEEESWKLFCYHAFQTSIPASGQFENIAREICEECKGLPLALEVIGSALWGTKDERDWSFALSRLRRSEAMANSKAVDDELFHRLKFSYDELDEKTKKCFLYFAAFPEDYEVSAETLCSIWHSEGLFGPCDDEDKFGMGRMNLITLADRSMIDLAEDGKWAKVHDVLRDLAIRIIREAGVGEWAAECHFEPGKVLKTFPMLKETTRRVSFVGTRIELGELPNNFQVLELQVCLLSRFFNPSARGETPLEFPKYFFSSMTKLLYLDLSWCKSLKELPESIKELKCLTHLNLSWCESLEELPESIKVLKCLTHLDLSWCKSLKELPESIKELKCLTHLNLSWCESLKELPESIKVLKCLTHLDLSWCKSLKELPESIKVLKCLTHLNLSWCDSLKKLPESIKELKYLTRLDLEGCKSLKKLPESIKELKCLTYLNLRWCEFWKELPESIKELKCLMHLDLSRCESLKELPESIKELKCLTHLDLSWCISLKELPESIKELKYLTRLDLEGCDSLKELPESIKELKCLTHLDLSWCDSLKKLPESIKELKYLTRLDLEGCKSLKELPESIKELKCLTYLNLRWCEFWKELPESIKELKCLMHLDLSRCESLKELPESIKELKCLRHLDLSWCISLKELPESIKELKYLMRLDLEGCDSLKELPESIKELKCLTHLNLSWCWALKELPESIKELKCLTHLNLSWCWALKELPESIKELKCLIL